MPTSQSAGSPRPIGLPPVSLAALAGVAEVAVSTRGQHEVSRHGIGVTGVTLRSADVRPGDLFAALPGSVTHGAAHVGSAAAAGAVAVLTDPAGYAMMLTQSDAAGLPVLISGDPRACLGQVASAIYGHPSRQLRVIGVTGTSGKTTTCFLLEAALTASGLRTGLIGTVAARIDGRSLPSSLTTPEAPDLQALFAIMVQRGVDVVAMEVSSHALALGRVSGTEFAVGAFTNLSQDHLDFHGDMEHYFAAKRLLFDGRARAEVIVIDDDYGRRLAVDRPQATTVSGADGAVADWTVHVTAGAPGIQHLTVTGPDGEQFDASISLPGSFNVTNAVTALACVRAAGLDASAVAKGLADVQVPGRMQRVDVGQPFLALVDYAHKPAALKSALAAVREHCAGRIILVVGAGGDRDHGKRPMMGQIATRDADLVIVTDDNPRSEDPAEIRRQILVGAVEGAGIGSAIKAAVEEIGDRRAAIIAAVQAAHAGDAILVAGKGHEQGQDIGGVVHPFNDVDELKAALADALGAAPGKAGLTP
ncbi:MAG: UDP-N-acetylmuramoyl-L-alanyl-D-glutamate--2,6-diaminopimelate ligase [Nakamurella sp.]